MSRAGRITDLKATTVSVPLEAPLRHANGVHWGRFVRTIVQVFTDSGLVGLGELGGGGESAEQALLGLKAYVLGHDPLELEALRWKLANPTASLYNNRLQLLAAVEFACLDIAGQALGVPVSTLLGGRLRERVPFASYLFYRYPDARTGAGGEESPEQMVAHARTLVDRCGFTTHKLKGGVFPPAHDVAVYRALAEAFPDASLRLDPNAMWSVEESIWVARQIADLRNDYLEDPTWGLDGMRRVRQRIGIPTATNTVVVNFEQLAQCIRQDAVDVILLDTTFWGGIRACVKAAATCETFQWGIAVHSSGELGIQLATMLHLGALLPNLHFAADAHYHHLQGDVIQGGPLPYVDGCIAVPTGPGLGVSLDADAVGRYAELYRELGGYPYDRDPARPGWFAILPGQQYATPGGHP
jgi:glucarate dehydratase